MSRTNPGQGCLDLAFSRSYALTDSAEAALEDYARVLAGSQVAETVSAPGGQGAVSGLHLCGAAGDARAALSELEEFARDLCARAGRGGLGWE
jgi:hypothetical protein